MSIWHFLFFQKIHFIVTHVQLLLQSSDDCRTWIHLLPNSELEDHFRLNKPATRWRLLLLVDHTANYLSSETMNELIFCKFVHFGNVQLVVISSADFIELSEIVIFHEITIGLIKPLSFFHLFKRITILVRIMLYNRLHLPKLRPLFIWFIP